MGRGVGWVTPAEEDWDEPPVLIRENVLITRPREAALPSENCCEKSPVWGAQRNLEKSPCMKEEALGFSTLRILMPGHMCSHQVRRPLLPTTLLPEGASGNMKRGRMNRPEGERQRGEADLSRLPWQGQDKGRCQKGVWSLVKGYTGFSISENDQNIL